MADKLTVYTVNYPLQYFAQRIAADHAEVIFPAPPDVDPAFRKPDTGTIRAYQQANLVLIAGFALHASGMRPSVTLLEFSEMGVTLLLFSIGLKLCLGSLLMPQIWGVASLHMAGTVVLSSLFIYGLGIAGISLFTGFAEDVRDELLPQTAS